MNKRNSAADLGSSRTGSVAPIFTAFVPDYTIKAVTDVLYLKIKMATFLRAIKASVMGKKASHSGGFDEKELDHLLEKVNEDESNDHELNMMLSTPNAHSPNRSGGTTTEQEATKVVKVASCSGNTTPVMAVRGDTTRGSKKSTKEVTEEEGGGEEEFWGDKDSVAVVVNVKPDKALEAAIAGGSHGPVVVVNNGEAVKDSVVAVEGGGAGLNTAVISATSKSRDPSSDSIRTSLLNKENSAAS